MTLIPNETEQALNRQYDVYAAAREEYRKKIAEQAARIERLEAEAKSRTLDYLGQVEQLMTESDAEFVERMFGYIKLRPNDFNRLKAIARRGAAMQWRPIETAPKEKGKYLLGWNRHHSGVIQYWPRAYEDDPEWVDESTEFIEPPVTHWMPLPPPPAGEQYHE